MTTKNINKDNALTTLSNLYNVWLKEQNLPIISADEHDEESLNEYQKFIIDSFIEIWEVIS